MAILLTSLSMCIESDDQNSGLPLLLSYRNRLVCQAIVFPKPTAMRARLMSSYPSHNDTTIIEGFCILLFFY
jgi:hypothetical protein